MPAEDRDAETRLEVALARRVATRLGLQDLEGRISARSPGGDSVWVTPGAGAATPRRLSADAILEVGLDGELRSGSVSMVPAGFELDLALYRRRSEIRSIAVGAPITGMAFGSVRRDILPLTHTWAEYAHLGTAWLDGAAVAPDTATADDLAREVGVSGFVHVPGAAVASLGDSPLDAIRRLDAFEYLARMTAIATALNPDPATVSAEEALAVARQRPKEPRPSRDFRRFYRSLDRAPGAAVNEMWPADSEDDRAVRDVAVACRLLARAGDLVAFFEHVGVRMPGASDTFAMSPAKDFSTIEPADVLVLSMADDCEPIIEKQLPAAPFRWYFRDIFVGRPDVAAIVHTHELVGRAFIAAGADSAPLHRLAVTGMLGEMPPVFPVPSLVFREEDRRDMLQLLGVGPWVHSKFHGTDFCSHDIRTSTVQAIHWDQNLRFAFLARSLGTPRAIQPSTLLTLSRTSPEPAAWWEYYSDALWS